MIDRASAEGQVPTCDLVWDQLNKDLNRDVTACYLSPYNLGRLFFVILCNYYKLSHPSRHLYNCYRHFHLTQRIENTLRLRCLKRLAG